MKIDDIESAIMGLSGKERFAIGAVAVVLGGLVAQPNLGLLTRLSAVLWLVGVASLGLSVEPIVTQLLGGERWNDLSTRKQMVALFAFAVVALVLWFVVTAVDSVLQTMF